MTWSVDGSELVYLRRWGDHSEMMAVAVAEEGDALRLGQPEVLFRVDRDQFSPPFPSWDCLPDGRFVLILDPTEEEQAASIRAMFPDRLRIVQGWTGKLRQF